MRCEHEIPLKNKNSVNICGGYTVFPLREYGHPAPPSSQVSFIYRAPNHSNGYLMTLTIGASLEPHLLQRPNINP